MRWASDRLEHLLLGLAGLVGDAGMEDWHLVRACLEIDKLKAVVRGEEEAHFQSMVAHLKWQRLEEGERPTKFLSKILQACWVQQR